MSNQAEAMMQDQIEGAQSENEALRNELDQLRGEQGVLVRLLTQCDGVLSTLEGESTDEQHRLDALRYAIVTMPHRRQEADLLSVRAGLGA